MSAGRYHDKSYTEFGGSQMEGSASRELTDAAVCGCGCGCGWVGGWAGGFGCMKLH